MPKKNQKKEKGVKPTSGVAWSPWATAAKVGGGKKKKAPELRIEDYAIGFEIKFVPAPKRPWTKEEMDQVTRVMKKMLVNFNRPLALQRAYGKGKN
jgi:hypothetical protein